MKSHLLVVFFGLFFNACGEEEYEKPKPRIEEFVDIMNRKDEERKHTPRPTIEVDEGELSLAPIFLSNEPQDQDLIYCSGSNYWYGVECSTYPHSPSAKYGSSATDITGVVESWFEKHDPQWEVFEPWWHETWNETIAGQVQMSVITPSIRGTR